MAGIFNMPKLSCKKRKLKYIREKNGLRDGRKLGVLFKVRSQFAQTHEGQAYVYNQLLDIKTKYETKYKLLLYGNLSMGYDKDDFAQDKTSIFVRLWHKTFFDSKTSNS